MYINCLLNYSRILNVHVWHMCGCTCTCTCIWVAVFYTAFLDGGGVVGYCHSVMHEYETLFSV